MKIFSFTLLTLFALMIIGVWGASNWGTDRTQQILEMEQIKLFYYFRGQVDAKFGEWRIEPVPETGAYQWKQGEPSFENYYKEFLDSCGNQNK